KEIATARTTKTIGATLRSIGTAIDLNAFAMSSPLRTAIAMRTCSSNPQNTVRHRIALRLFESRNAMPRITTKPIRAESRSTSCSFSARHPERSEGSLVTRSFAVFAAQDDDGELNGRDRKSVV